MHHNRFPVRLISYVIRDPGAADVDTNPLRGHFLTPACLTDAQNHIGLKLPGLFQYGLGRKAEDSRDFQLAQLVFPNHLRQQLHSFP